MNYQFGMKNWIHLSCPSARKEVEHFDLNWFQRKHTSKFILSSQHQELLKCSGFRRIILILHQYAIFHPPLSKSESVLDADSVLVVCFGWPLEKLLCLHTIDLFKHLSKSKLHCPITGNWDVRVSTTYMNDSCRSSIHEYHWFHKLKFSIFFWIWHLLSNWHIWWKYHFFLDFYLW
jgi:hypothetical protein